MSSLQRRVTLTVWEDCDLLDFRVVLCCPSTVVFYFMWTKSVMEPAFGWLRIAGKSSLTESRLESVCLGRRTLRLPMNPPTKLRIESPEMAGLRPEEGVDGVLLGGVVTLTERWRKAAISSFFEASSNGLWSAAVDPDRLRKLEISAWILPVLNTAPGIEAILSCLFAFANAWVEPWWDVGMRCWVGMWMEISLLWMRILQ